jgi:Zn-dependent M16 (insulinase) family peptidase
LTRLLICSSTKGFPHRELEKTIMGILAEDLAPLSPGEKNGRSLFYQVMGLTYEQRRAVRASYFQIDSPQIQEAARFLKNQMESLQFNVSLTPQLIVDGDQSGRKEQWKQKKLL